MSIGYILLAVLLFGILIAVHEFGHFSVAKLCGVKVNEFAVGMGPALWKKQKGETLYALRVIPFGGAGEGLAVFAVDPDCGVVVYGKVFHRSLGTCSVVCRGERTALSDALVVLRGIAADDLVLFHLDAEMLSDEINGSQDGEKRISLAAARSADLPNLTQ